MTNDTNTIFDFLRAEGLTYRGAVIDLSEKITAFLIDGDSDSMARASELTKSLQRLIDLDA
jgi:hypothetical protein